MHEHLSILPMAKNYSLTCNSSKSQQQRTVSAGQFATQHVILLMLYVAMSDLLLVHNKRR